MPDTRQTLRQLTPVEIENIGLIKAAGDEMLRLLSGPGRDCREAAIARTKVEEAVMWAVKGITG